MGKEGLRLALGLVVIGLGAYFAYRAVKWTYFALFPPSPSASLSLSAFFEEVPAKPAVFSIAGEAQQAGKPVQGKVKIGIEKVHGNFRQSFILELKDGKFVAAGLPAFGWLRKCDRIHAIAEVWSPDLTAGPLSEELTLNAGTAVRRKSALYPVMWILVFLIVGTFVFVFTGNRTPGKNRVAIILSYCMIIISLAVPLLAPFVFVRTFPDVMEAMKESPVGLLITKGEKQEQTQWVLNIGGHVKRPDSPCEELESAASGKPVGGRPTFGAPAQEEGKVASSAASGSTSMTQSQPSGSSAPAVQSSSNGVAAGQKNQSPSETESDVVNLEGGLAIPLYVILLSIIGGAINMTRKVPRIQRDVEESEMNLKGVLQFAHETLTMVRSGLPSSSGKTSDAESAGPAESDANAESVNTTPPAGQASSGTEKPPAAQQGQPSTSSDAADWRTNLLDQYMYLLSAPFLAIATYYLLLWLELNKPPALVLVSFSVGLISERVLSAITGKAGDLLGGASDAGKNRATATPTTKVAAAQNQE